MNGFLNLPEDKSKVKTYIYTPFAASMPTNNNRGLSVVWNKPPGISFVYGLLIGSGGGGGGGGSVQGGGGGAAGGIVQFVQPAIAVPDILYVTVGFGGPGGAGGNPTGTAGTQPTVDGNTMGTTLSYRGRATNPRNVLNSVYQAGVAYVGITNGGGGGAGTSNSTGGAGGTAATDPYVAASTFSGLHGMANFTRNTGVGGGASNLGTLAAGVTVPFLGRPQGGASGGSSVSGVFRTGGSVLGSGAVANSIIPYDLLGGQTAGAKGADGFTLYEPTFISLPGAGGASNPGGVGGAGGYGGIGCGGGGGGAGTTGGRGGDGGPGLVILVCW
jgi:hypothetical protein